MTRKQNDPVLYLRNLVAKKGKSSKDGVYYVHPTVMADANEDYGYDTDHYNEAIALFDGDDSLVCTEDWNEVLVRIRKGSEMVTPVVVRNGTHLLEFISEDHDLLLRVVIPSLSVEKFDYEVEFYQTLMSKVAQFAGKNPISIRFSIGIATISWEDLVDSGEAQETDVGF